MAIGVNSVLVSSTLILLCFVSSVLVACCCFGGPFCSFHWWSREVFGDSVVPCSVFEVLLVAVLPISSEVRFYGYFFSFPASI